MKRREEEKKRKRRKKKKRRREEEEKVKDRSNYFPLTLSKNIRDLAGRAKMKNISEY